MYSFKNDYSEIAHPEILKAMSDAALIQEEGYCEDRHSKEAARLLKQLMGREDVDVHMMIGGTQTNLTAIGAFLRPHEAVVASDKAHICVHETGAVEATGHKILEIPSQDGKIQPEQIKQVLEAHTDEHMVKPRLVKISNVTELGAVYRRSEIKALSEFCHANGLLLYLDGARLGTAMCAQFTDPAEKAELTHFAQYLDAFYIGGTKNGALIGEALVLCNDELKKEFRFSIKQRGGLLAKGSVIGLQFEVLFREGLYYELAKHSNRMAGIIKAAVRDTGYTLQAESDSNVFFPILPNRVIAELKKSFDFHVYDVIDQDHTAIRLVTSWATREEQVTAFTETLRALS